MSGRTPFRLAYDLSCARPLFIDAWPASWAASAPATTLVWLDAAEMAALGAHIMGYRHWFGALTPTPIKALRHRLEAALARSGTPAFVRLTSRSPKDSLWAMRHGLCVHSADNALAMVLEGSARAAHDLRSCLDAGVPLAFVVRHWVCFEPWQEWRCVMRGRRWAGASARLDLNDAQTRHAVHGATECAGLLKGAVAELADAAHVDDAVFDLLAFPGDANGEPGRWQLLDANPLLSQTSLGWFGGITRLDESIRTGPLDSALPVRQNPPQNDTQGEAKC